MTFAVCLAFRGFPAGEGARQMKTNKPTAGRDAQRTAPASTRTASQRASAPDTLAAANGTDAAFAPPPQPNWIRYADSRLRQFYCR